MKNKIDGVLRAAIHACFETGTLTRSALPEYTIEVPNNADHGHFATNLPMTLAASQKRPPRQIAAAIVDGIEGKEKLFENVSIAGPGFINFIVRREEWLRLLRDILSLGSAYGGRKASEDAAILVEYVSANPTGPLHLGHGRGAAIGDTLCRILSFRGRKIVREFYINDAGEQVRLLGESIFSRFKQTRDPNFPFPEKGYHGDYVIELATGLSEVADIEGIPQEEAIALCARYGREKMLEETRKDLEQFRVVFDNWYSETTLLQSGLLQKTLDAMSSDGQIYEKDGALWIRTSQFQDDKDRVLKKSDGRFTYFASDIAYHLDKWDRGFSKAINLWGADHHGYVPRIRGSLMAHGLPEDWLSVLLIQLVKLWKGGGEVKMSKRAGSYVTLRELLDEIGVDAARFVFLTKSHDSPLDVDIDVVKKQDSDNPVYYVQYAHARICSVFRKAQEEGITLPDEPGLVLSGLGLNEELMLIRMMSEFPTLLEEICRTLEPHRLTYYLSDIAAAFHRYFNLGTKRPEHRIVTPDTQMAHARLFLADAVRTVIATGLDLLGVAAPQIM
jgi:arginyl-tRNA synthetase